MAWLVLLAGTLLGSLATLAITGTTVVRRVDLYRWVAQRRHNAGSAELLLSMPARLFRSGSSLATVGIATAGAGLAGVLASLSPAVGMMTLGFVALPLVLVLGISIPFAVAPHWADAIVHVTVPWLHRLAYLFAPVGSAAMNPLGSASHVSSPDHPEASDREELDELAGIVAFTERPVRDVMRPRTEIISVREGTTLADAAERFDKSGLSRLPVYRESPDDIVGMIYVFDLLKIGPAEELPIRAVLTIPASNRCVEALALMLRERRQLAVVLDEYGGTAGLVTLEDLIEELVGEIFDEYDAPPTANATTVEIVEATGATAVSDIATKFDLQFGSTAETVGGLLAQAAGQIPKTGDRYLLAGLEFDVLEATPMRVERVLIRRGATAVIPLEA